MMPFELCPICGGELVPKAVDKLLRGGVNTAVLRVVADVCLHCGEHLYPPEMIRRFEDVRSRLRRGDTGQFEPIGVAYQAS